MNLSDFLSRIGACRKAVIWAKPYGDDYVKAYKKCNKGDWLVWLLRHSKDCDFNKMIRFSCKISRLVTHLAPEQITACAEAVEKYMEDKATLKEVMEIKGKVWSFADCNTIPESFKYYAVYAGYYTCSAIQNHSPYSSVSATTYCAIYAAGKEGSYAEKKVRKQIADIIREEYPEPFKLR